MESQHFTQQTFAEALNLSPASLSSIFNDRTKPTLNHVDAIRKRFPQINLEWLLYGTGEMFASAPSAPSSSANATSQGEPMLDFDEPAESLFQQDAQFHQTPYQQSQYQHSPAAKPAVQHIEPVVKYVDKPQRRISEIRVYYDDQTWETFVSSSK